MSSPPAVERRHPPNQLMRMVNPLMRRVIARGGSADQLLMLHYEGRRSGRQFDTPAGYSMIDGQIFAFTNSPWRHNFTGGAPIEVTYRGQRRPAYAILINDPDQVADLYEKLFHELGWPSAQRRVGVRVNVKRQPTRDELLQAIRSSGLSAVRLDFQS